MALEVGMNKIDKKVIVSSSILIVLSVVLSLLDIETFSKFSIWNHMVGFLLEIIWVVVVVLVVRAVRGELSIWGYVWRTFLVKYVSLMTVIIFLALASMTNIEPSVKYTLILITPSIIISIVYAWLFHSNNRREHLIKAVNYINGY